MNPTTRDRRVVCDVVLGKAMVVVAGENAISVQRVSQIVNRVLNRKGARYRPDADHVALEKARDDPAYAIAKFREIWSRQKWFDPDTPEGFYRYEIITNQRGGEW